VSNFNTDENNDYDIEGTTEEVMNLDTAEVKQNKMFGSYITYTMVNTKNERIDRKFNDFVLLRKAFVHNFPGWYIPKIPEKRYGVDKSDDKSENFELKKFQLDDFTSKLSSVSHLVSSDIYQAFIKPKINVDKTLKRYLNPTKKEILDRLKDVFFDLSNKEINAELVDKIEKFDDNLKSRLVILKQFKVVIHKKIEGFGTCNNKISALMSALGSFEEIFMDYTKDLRQSDNNDALSKGYFKELQTNQTCPYYSMDAFINNEIADYEAFIEGIKTQRSFLSYRRTVRYQLDKQLEQFNKMDNYSNSNDDKIKKIQQKLESLEIGKYFRVIDGYSFFLTLSG